MMSKSALNPLFAPLLLAVMTVIVTAQGPVAFESVAMATAGSDVQTLTIKKPSGTAEDDLLIAMVNAEADETLSPPAGWTVLQHLNSCSPAPSSW